MSTLRERIAALVYGPRPTLDEWLDPNGRAGLVRSALESETREADEAREEGRRTGLREAGLTVHAWLHDHEDLRDVQAVLQDAYLASIPPPANTENGR